MGSLYDLDEGMKNVARLSKQGGLVLVEAWDRESWPARLFGKRWHANCPPSMVHWYTVKTLTSIFKSYC